ncbi:unnamed protein product [Closterium sp. NIES-53]
MALRPSSVPLRVPLPSHHASPLPVVPVPKSDLARAANPTVPRLLATLVTDPSFESTAVSALVAELVDFAAACRLDYATSLVAESESDCPPSVGGECALGTDVLEDSLRWPVYGLRQVSREWHDTLRTILVALGFAPSTADPSLFLRTDTLLPPFYILLYIDDLVFATADTEALALVLQCFGFWYSSPQSTPLPTGHSLSAPPSDEFVEPSGPYIELVGCLVYLMTCTRPDLAYPLSILAHYVASRRHRPEHWEAAKRVLRYLCSTLGMGLVLGGRGPIFFTGRADTSWVEDLATQQSSQGYTFNLGSGFVSWRSTRSSSVLGSSCEAEIYAGATAAHELPWLTYLLTDLGEHPRSPPVLYVDNKAMIALCQEHRLEHRTKHIALRYFLARELQQRGQLRLSYVATWANTADIFTKAFQSAGRLFFAPLQAATTSSEPQPVLTFDAEGRAVDFEVWLDDLQLFLQCDRADGLSLFYLTSGLSPAPPATADSTVRSQWATRDAAARLAVRRHLPTTERAHFSQYRSAQTLYDAVVARYSSPATAALSRLFLPYLFPDLAAFPTVADLITHMRTSDARYRAALPAEFCAKNPPPLYLTLYYVVTRLPDTLRVVRDHFLSVCPTTLTVDLLEERLLAAEQSIVAVGASRGDPRTPIFEGCSPSPLLPSVASAATADLGGFESVVLHSFALRYFLARELQQRGQLRLAYVASEANTADIFTKALTPGDHQRFCTLLACFALLDWSCFPTCT